MPNIIGPFLKPYSNQSGAYPEGAYFPFVLYNRTGNDFDGALSCVSGDVKINTDIIQTNRNITDGCFALNDGGYLILLTPTELTCAFGVVYVIDQAAPKKWIDTAIFFETYGHPLSAHPHLGKIV